MNNSNSATDLDVQLWEAVVEISVAKRSVD